MKSLLLLFLFILVAHVSLAQAAVPTNNDERLADLHAHGVKLERPAIMAWFPIDSVSNERMSRLVDSLNQQITIARAFMGAPHSWQVFGTTPVTIYFSRGNFVANTAADGSVFIPLWRMRKNKAPYLHEIMHVLLRSSSGNWNNASRDVAAAKMPIWFTEGMPEYMALKIATVNRFPKFDLHRTGGYARVDSICSKIMKTEVGKVIDPYIGGEGVLVELFGSRRGEFSPAFYTCSCSFTKYLAEKYGIESMLNAISGFQKEIQIIESTTGKSMPELKKAWLASFGDR